jgi:hypothetical protein
VAQLVVAEFRLAVAEFRSLVAHPSERFAAESAPDALATPPRPTTLAEARLPEERVVPRLVKAAALWLAEAAAPLLTQAVPGPSTSALLQETSKLVRAC